MKAEFWQQLLEHARTAASHGQKELLLLRFPAGLCSDGGRRIDVAEPGWETTLRGEAAEIYDLWAENLKDHGFGLHARALSYDDERRLGDLGLFLTWGE